MVKVRKLAVSSFLLIIWMLSSVSALSQVYETELIFYHEQVFPKDFYWVIMQSEYQGSQIEAGTKQILNDIKTLKQIIEEHNHLQNDQKVSQQPQNKTIQLIIGSQSGTSCINLPEQQAFSHKLTEKVELIKFYQLTLGSLDIQLSSPFSIRQQIFIRIPSHNRQHLSQIVDKIQSQFNGSQTLRILSIQKGNINSFSDSELSQLYQKNVQQIIDEEKLTSSIHSQAEKYCHSLNMDLYQVLSFNPLIDQELYNLTQTQNSQEQPLSDFQDAEQMTYDQAYQLVSNKQFYDYQNVFYEVKAICKGNRKPQQIKSPKIRPKNQKKHKKVTNQDKIQKQLNKLNNKLKNQKLF